MGKQKTTPKVPRVDTFVNVTKLHEQVGGPLEQIRGLLSYEVRTCGLVKVLECSWCPEDIKKKIASSLRDLSNLVNDIVKVQTFLADNSRSLPAPVSFRCGDQNRIFKLSVINGNPGQDTERSTVAQERRDAQ